MWYVYNITLLARGPLRNFCTYRHAHLRMRAVIATRGLARKITWITIGETAFATQYGFDRS